MTDPTLPTMDQPGDVLAATNRRNRVVITLMLVSAFVVILNETIMGVAIPVLEAPRVWCRILLS